METRLKFINLSNAAEHPSVVFFQDRIIKGFDDLALAWKVIRRCGYENYHPFVFPLKTEISTKDSYGNYTTKRCAKPGDSFRVYRSRSGQALTLSGKSQSIREIELRNELDQGAVDATLFKEGLPFSAKTAIAPGQKAVFQVKPTLFVGVASEIEEGAIFKSSVLSGKTTKLTLVGVASAEIVMTGGGGGPEAQPFVFTMENVTMA